MKKPPGVARGLCYEKKRDRYSSAMVWMPSSLSCTSSTGEGHSLMSSLAFCTFGKAMTSRMESAPAMSITSRSSPMPKPP